MKRRMKAKQYLARIRLADVCIEQREAQAMELMELVAGMDPGDREAKYRELIRHVNGCISSWKELREDTLRNALGAIGNETAQKIIYLKYAKGLKLREVADLIEYSKNYVCSLHAKAMRELDQMDFIKNAEKMREWRCGSGGADRMK